MMRSRFLLLATILALGASVSLAQTPATPAPGTVPTTSQTPVVPNGPTTTRATTGNSAASMAKHARRTHPRKHHSTKTSTPAQSSGTPETQQATPRTNQPH